MTGEGLRGCCAGCGRDDVRLHACSACRKASYCGRACQRKDWPRHRRSGCGTKKKQDFGAAIADSRTRREESDKALRAPERRPDWLLEEEDDDFLERLGVDAAVREALASPETARALENGGDDALLSRLEDACVLQWASPRRYAAVSDAGLRKLAALDEVEPRDDREGLEKAAFDAGARRLASALGVRVAESDSFPSAAAEAFCEAAADASFPSTRRLLGAALDVLADDAPNAVASLKKIATIARRYDRLVKTALHALQRAMDLASERDRTDVARDLADLYRFVGDPDRAVDLDRRVLDALLLSDESEKAPDLVLARARLALADSIRQRAQLRIALRDQPTDLAEARRLFDDALVAFERLAPDDPAIADLLHGLAHVVRLQDPTAHDESCTIGLRALELARRHRGDSHPSVQVMHSDWVASLV